VPLVALYRARGMVRVVDADRPAPEVLATVRRCFSPRVAFFLGGPGSGKGTQCARVAAEFGYTHLSTGDLLRAEVERGTPEGAAVAALLADAKMVPAALTLSLVPIVVGVSVASATDVSFSWVGCLAALASNLASTARNVYSKQVMSGVRGNIDSVSLLTVVNAMAFVMLVPALLLIDGPTLLDMGWEGLQPVAGVWRVNGPGPNWGPRPSQPARAL
jgi:hypothetical protein